MTRSWDAVVAGGGPAGSITALVLARAGHRVLLADCSDAYPRVGEALPPAARPLLRDLGLLPRVLAGGHLTCVGNASAWGSAELQVADFIFNAHGTGLHLDRRRFDESLRTAAAEAGAEVVRGRIECSGGVRLRLDRRQERLESRWIVDASGRGAAVARSCGARKRIEDALIAFHARFEVGDADTDSRTIIEACEDGWWYTARLPGGSRLVAFFTDRDLGSRRAALSTAGMMRGLRRTVHVGRIVGMQRGTTCGRVRGADAASSRLDRFAGGTWIAAGDAAIAFDPLSSQGLFNALYTGMKAGEALCGALAGDRFAIARYAARLEAIHQAYRRNLRWFYGLERRWPAERFWARRHFASAIRRDTDSRSRSASRFSCGRRASTTG
jgi:flavin-dependent dehydrogenase